MGNVFSFWIGVISTCVNFLFSLKINENPDITIGMFLLACAFIGLAIYFVLGTDFIPIFGFNRGSGSSNSNGSDNNYVPRHSPGNAGKDFSTRESRHRY